MKQIYVSSPTFLGSVEFLVARPVTNTPRGQLIGVVSSGREFVICEYPSFEMAQTALHNCGAVVMSANVKDAYIDFTPQQVPQPAPSDQPTGHQPDPIEQPHKMKPLTPDDRKEIAKKLCSEEMECMKSMGLGNPLSNEQ